MSRWACAALLALGCGHAAPPATPPPGTQHAAHAPDAAIDSAPPKLEDDLQRLAARALALFQAWQRALVDAGEDCAAATEKLNHLALEYADVIEANVHIAHAGHDKIKQLREALAQYDEQMDAAAEGIAHSKTMANCASDAQFAHAIDRIGGAPP